MLSQTMARADVYNRQLVPIGETEAFMANTGTGRATDTGAVYYNPASLALQDESQVSVSGSVYLSTSLHVDSLAQVGGQSVPADQSFFNTIPSTYVASRQVGRFHVAFSVLVPDYVLSDLVIAPNTSASGPGLLNVSSFHLNELWIGPSIAEKLSERWSIGATLYGVAHSESTVAGTFQSNPSSATTAAELLNSQLSAQGLTVILGVHFKASESISLGLRAQSPFLQVHGSASVFDSTLDTGASASGTLSSMNQNSLSARYRLPADFTLGTAFRIGHSIQLLYDTSLQLPVHYQSIPSFSASASYNTGTTVRYNLGVEANLSEKLLLRAGLFYNPSSVNDISLQPEGTLWADIYGATAGLGWQSEHIRTGVGMIGYRGNGHIRPSGSAGTLASGSVHAIGALLTTSYVF